MPEKEILQPTEQAKKLIAESTADFLRTRMQITQEILSNNNIETISLDDYINGLAKIKDNRQEVREYSKQNMSKIFISPEEIEELVSLVKESLMKYSIGDIAFSGRFSNLVRDAISNLKKNINDDDTLNPEEKISKLSIIKKWNEISYGDYSFGIDPRIQGSVSWRYFDEFYITDSKDHFVSKIGLDGTDKMVSENREKQQEDILLAYNLFIGKIYMPGRETFSIFFYKFNDDKAKVVGENSFYPTTKGSENESYVELGMPLNIFLDINGLSYLSEDLYDEFMIQRIAQVYKRSIELTNEENEIIEKVISHAVDWWANAISNPKFNNGDFKASLLANTLSSTMPKPQDEKIEKFKEYLGNEIRAGILSTPYGFNLSVDYDPDMYLYKAASKAKLDTGITSFPWKTTMTITADKVSVSAGYGADYEVIYDANQDSLGPNDNKFKNSK